jgi:hypothetical protein
MKLQITIILIAGLTALASAKPKGQVDAKFPDLAARTINTFEEAKRAVVEFRKEYKHAVAQDYDSIIDFIGLDLGVDAMLKSFDVNGAAMSKTIDELILDVDELFKSSGGGVHSPEN